MLTTLFNAFLSHRLIIGSVSELLRGHVTLITWNILEELAPGNWEVITCPICTCFRCECYLLGERCVCVNRALGILIY